MESMRYNILAYERIAESRQSIVNALADTSDLTFRSDESSFNKEIGNKHYDVVFLNISPDTSAPFNLLEKTKKQTPYTPIIITSQQEKAELVVDAMKKGAADFVVQPFSTTRIQIAVQQALKQRELKNEIDYLRRKQDIVYDFSGIIAETNSIKKIITSLKKFAHTDSTILITGDTGTGKSFLSGSIHFNSPRRKKPFIKINCANIPEALLESELFGHERGAFTGADKQRVGRFEQANGGTIFLDEIGEISLEIQTKLLRVLEEKAFERVGGNRTIHVDVRVIAATNKDLGVLIGEGKFREDLYYRINVLPVVLPPLRDRHLCLEPLAKSLLAKTCKSMKRPMAGFSPAAMSVIQGYHWPGNIRQLANTIERAVILEESHEIQPENISIPDFHPQAPGKSTSNGYEPLEMHAKDLIIRALEESLWVQKNAAKKLGISPRSLNYKINKFGITHPHWRKNR